MPAVPFLVQQSLQLLDLLSELMVQVKLCWECGDPVPAGEWASPKGAPPPPAPGVVTPHKRGKELQPMVPLSWLCPSPPALDR